MADEDEDEDEEHFEHAPPVVIGMPVQVRAGSETDAGLIHSIQGDTISATIFRHGAVVVHRNLAYDKAHGPNTWRHIQDAIE